MDHCSGIWGFHNNKKMLDQIHQQAIRSFHTVNKYAPSSGMEGDMVWIPPIIRRKLDILRLWNRIVGLELQIK